MTGPAGVDRDAVERAVREVLARERARVGDPGAMVLGADPDDGHGWHAWAPDKVQQPREPGVPLFHADCWRFFRLLDLACFEDALLVAFAWDELGTPNLRYLTLVRFSWAAQERGPTAVALLVRGHLRYLLSPTETAVTSIHRDPAEGPGWRERCGRVWLDSEHVLVTPGGRPDQEQLDVRWELPWPSLTRPR